MDTLKNKTLYRLSKSCVGAAESAAVAAVMRSEFLGMGTKVKEFERGLEEFLGRRVVCVANGTSALQLALQACGIKPGDEVLVQSLTYVATFQAISASGATPIACDICPKTFTIDLDDASKKVTSRTKAIVPVHYAGGVGPLSDIYAFAKNHGLRAIEDAAHAFGTTYAGKLVGSIGDVAVFSFDGIKNITSGEGGCVASNDEALIQSISDARLLGVINDSNQRYSGERSWDFDVKEQGWRYHMSDLMASIGIEQLKRFPDFRSKRQELATRYVELLQNEKKIELLQNNYHDVVPHIFPIILEKDVNRNALRRNLLAKGVETGVHYKPNHHLTFFGSKNYKSLVTTDDVFSRILTLPMHPDLVRADVDAVADHLLSEIVN